MSRSSLSANLEGVVQGLVVKFPWLPTFIKCPVSVTQLYTSYCGFKTFDRDKIDIEIERVQVTNCADSASSVLNTAGIASHPSILSYATPTGINSLFDPNPCIGDTKTPPQQKDQTSSNSQSLGFFSNLSNAIKDFFNTKSVDESPICTSNSEGCSAHESDKESYERVEASSPNTSESSFSFFNRSNDNKASSLTRHEEEEDLSYVQRMDALVGGTF